MKTKHLVIICVSALGLFTIGLILSSIQNLLPSIAVKMLIALLVLASIGVCYLFYCLYERIHARAHAIRMRNLELAAAAQQIAIEQGQHQMERERWQVERSALLLTQQHAASRIYPDNKGYMPTIVHVSEAEGYQYIQLPHPAHQGRLSAGQQQPSLPDKAESIQRSFPNNVRYEQIARNIPTGHGLLGLTEDNQIETADFQDFMTMLITGGSNSGKTNTISLKLHEANQNGRNMRLIVIDWHWRKPDSLYNKIKVYENHFLMPLIKDEESTLPALEWFYNEFKRRLRDGITEQDCDILLVADEVPGMMDAEDERIPKMLKLIAKKCGREARGFGMFGWFIAQQMIGLAWLRNIVHTTIGHKATRMNEAVVVCNEHTDIARDMENWPVGRVIVYGQNFQGVKVLQMPIFTPPKTVEGSVEHSNDEMEPLQPKFPNSSIINFQTHQWKRDGNGPETAQEKGGKDTGEISAENAVTLKNLLATIRERRAAGTPLNTILREYGVNGGRAHQEVKQLIDEMEA